MRDAEWRVVYDPGRLLTDLSDLMVDTSKMPWKDTGPVEEGKKFIGD